MAVALDVDPLGREDEFARLRGFLASLSQGPRAFVLRGDAGIGKTTLWRAATESAEAGGLTLLSARCVEAERPLALVGLSDLVRDAFPAVAVALADHERAALAVATGLEPPDASSSDAVALPRAFLALLERLARDTPVLLAVDDVQWLDVPSARIVSFAARRLGTVPVGILVAQRGDGPDPVGLANAFDPARLEDIRVGPLSVGALAHLVRARFDVRIPRPVLARVHRASGGNPMFALEFARSFVEQGRPQLGPMPMPASLHELVHARVERWSPDVRDALAIVAAAERPTPSLLSAVDPAYTGSLDVAVDAGAVAIGDDGVVRFTHPLLASAVYAELPSSRRRELHNRLAHVVKDLEERARHLALTAVGPDAAISAVLAEAAARADARGAPETAAELAEEAVRLTPPADAPDLEERALAVAWYLGGAGRTADACSWVDARLATGLAGTQRARALLLRAILEHDVEAGGRALAEALQHVGEDPALRARVLIGTSSYHFYRDDFPASETTARQALAAAEEDGDPALLATALAMVADRAELTGHAEPALLERSTALATVSGMLPGYPSLAEARGRRLLRAGDLDGARRSLEPELHAALRSAAAADRYRLGRDLAAVELYAGNWPRARRHIDDGWEFVCDSAGAWPEAEMMERRAHLAALCGDADDARRVAALGIACAEALHWPHLAAQNRWVLGFLELSRDEPEQAWNALEDVAQTAAWGRLEVLAAVADAAEALVALGRLESADGLVTAKLDDEARKGHRWAAAAAARCRALILTAQGDSTRSVAEADRAADGFAAFGCRLDTGRARLAAGTALRRAGERRRAAEKLEAAKAIFSELNANLWAERAAKELRRASPRPRHDRELTPAERQVAAVVAAGRTNKEVAAQLFTTVATVEAHLTRIYRKLGIRSRTDLARRVADGTLSLDD